MNILMIGDIVAKPGRVAVLQHLAALREQYKIDIAIANVENTAGGFSITPALADELFRAGIDLMTSGNHIFDKSEVIPYISNTPRLIRPANYPPETPGSGMFIGEIGGFKIAAINLMGRVFMPPNLECPFRSVDQLISLIPNEVKIRFVDFHCEATSEKYAMGWHLAGRVSAVVGTHTHVPTADERILNGATAYITDLGMTGSYAGCIGMNKEHVIERFTKVPARRADHSNGDVWICGVVIEVDEVTGKALSIARLKIECN